jgi:hypothetical protein
MSFEAIPDLLADILEQQRRTTEAVIGLSEAIAGIRAKAVATAKEAKPDPKPAAAAASAEAQAQTAPAATTAESRSEPVVIGDVNAAIIALAKAKGRDAAVALLGTFGAAKAPELKPEQYADVVAAAKKAMA